jgi:hypothetical protein
MRRDDIWIDMFFYKQCHFKKYMCMSCEFKMENNIDILLVIGIFAKIRNKVIWWHTVSQIVPKCLYSIIILKYDDETPRVSNAFYVLSQKNPGTYSDNRKYISKFRNCTITGSAQKFTNVKVMNITPKVQT